MIPAACQCATAESRSRPIFLTACGAVGPLLIHTPAWRPATKSISIQAGSCASSTRWIRTMFGWFSRREDVGLAGEPAQELLGLLPGLLGLAFAEARAQELERGLAVSAAAAEHARGAPRAEPFEHRPVADGGRQRLLHGTSARSAESPVRSWWRGYPSAGTCRNATGTGRASETRYNQALHT